MSAQVISFKCILKNKAGKLISSTYNKDVLTLSELNNDGLLSGLNKNLQNLKTGEKRVISILAEEAYGLYDPKKIILYPKSKLPKNIRKGDAIKIMGKSGQLRSYVVTDIHSDFASLDGNHPLAGQDLVFEIDALEVRQATKQELDESLNTLFHQMLH